MVGIEDNAAALAVANKRLNAFNVTTELVEADFLSTPYDVARPQLDLLAAAVPTPSLVKPQIIIANPPYVRTQILGAQRAQQLAQKYNLRGRVDLYYAFLIAMTEALEERGLLGVITSNRFLTTRSGESVRQFLDENYDLIEVIDLGDTKLFSAAVLPAIIVARKRTRRGRDVASAPPTFTRVYEVMEAAPAATAWPASSALSAIGERRDGHYSIDGRIFEVTSGKLAVSGDHREPWRLATQDQAAWVDLVERAATTRIGDVAKVRVGIKTTADKIFIRSDWTDLDPGMQPEAELLRPLFTHFDADRWRAGKSGRDLLQILYPHESVNGKRQPVDLARYPRAARYLESQRDALEGRSYVTEAGRKWYEIWVPQDPAAWALPKIVFPDISVEPKFFFDESAALVNGDCYWIAIDDTRVDLLLLIQGVANSSVMTRYHDLAFNNKLYSGRRRYISQYIQRYPIPDPSSKIAKDIVKIVRSLNDQPTAAGEEKLNRLVAAAFGVAL
jgi:hypothetical protein